MSEDFSLESRDGVSIIRLHRQLPMDRLMDIVERVALQVSDRRLWNVANYFDYPPAEVKRLSQLGRKLWSGPARVAYVAEETVFYGMLRMFEAYRDQDGYETRAFRDEASALEWLDGEPQRPNEPV